MTPGLVYNIAIKSIGKLSMKLTVLFMVTSAERSSDFLVDELPLLEYTVQSLWPRHLNFFWRLKSEIITEFRRKDRPLI